MSIRAKQKSKTLRLDMLMTHNTDPSTERIPAELRQRIAEHAGAAHEWLEPFMDWCDRFIAIRNEYWQFATAENAAGRHIVDPEIEGREWMDAVARAGGYDRIDLIRVLVEVEAQRMEAFVPGPLDPVLEAMVRP